MQAEQFLTRSLQDRRLARVLHAAVEAVDPAQLVTQGLLSLRLPAHRRTFLLGIGKAAEAMTRAAANALPTIEATLVITKHRTMQSWPATTILEAGHPVPDNRSLRAGQAALEFVRRLQEDDLLICLISGGGSALMTAPVHGLTLEDLQELTSAALASGVDIEEVNTLRRQLDVVKGGGLATATRATVISLILSDVMGDRLETIASGPTFPNPTGQREAMQVLAKLGNRVPGKIRHILQMQAPAAESKVLDRVSNMIIGNGALAAGAACARARMEGFVVENLGPILQGEARAVGRNMASRLAAACRDRARPFCLVAAGETTVTLVGTGRGGRNQELALAAVDVLEGEIDCCLVALATDGNDGPTDAAGAVVTGLTRKRGAELDMSAHDFLARNDSYAFFDALQDLLQPGYTGTNVGDLLVMCGL